MKRRGFVPAIPVIFLLIIFSSCSVEQNVMLDGEGGGEAEVDITLEPVLVRYFTDLLEFSGDEVDSIFDEAAIRAAFRDIPELELTGLSIVSKGRLRLFVKFTDLEKAFFDQVGSGVAPAVDVNRSAEGWKTSLYLNTDNYRKITERMMALTGMAAFEDYLAGLLEPGPEEVIIDMYGYAFEDYLDGISAEEVLEKSNITLRFTAPKEILGHRGGRIFGGNTIRFVIPLLDILTLEKPIYYHFLYN